MLVLDRRQPAHEARRIHEAAGGGHPHDTGREQVDLVVDNEAPLLRLEYPEVGER